MGVEWGGGGSADVSVCTLLIEKEIFSQLGVQREREKSFFPSLSRQRGQRKKEGGGRKGNSYLLSGYK